MKVAIVTGSRRWKDKAAIQIALASFLEPGDLLVHGGAIGADSIAKEWAKRNKVKTKSFRPKYDKWPVKIAPLVRNWEMMAYGAGRKAGGDIVRVFAFPLPGTGGTYSAIRAAEFYLLKVKLAA